MSPGVLILLLAGVLGLAQLGLLGLARLLGLRLDRRAIAAGLGLPLLLLLVPWLTSDVLLAPADVLSGHIPGTPPELAEGPHVLLNDSVFQFLPWELEVRHAFRDRRLPLWSDSLDGGSSPWVNPQAGVLSPLAWLARPLPIQHFFLALLALKVLVAFEGAWLLARRAGASRGAALLAGVAFGLGGGILAWGLFPHTRAAAWVPWVAAGALGLLRRPRLGSVVGTALATAALLLAGHPETALAGGLFAAAIALALRQRRSPIWKGAGSAAAAALLGLALAAPQVLPFLAFLPQTQRAQETPGTAEGWRQTVDRMSLREPASWFREGRAGYLLSPAHPHALGRPYREPGSLVPWPDATAAYAGLAAVGGTAAALLSLLGLGRPRRALPFLAWAAGALLLAAEPKPVMALLLQLPWLRAFTYPRLLLVVALALAVAGALGVDALRRAAWRERGRRLPWPWLGLGLATALSLGIRFEAGTAALWAGLWVAALLAAVAGGLRRVLLRRLAPALLLLVALADLLPWARLHLPRGGPHFLFPRNLLLERVQDEVGKGGPWRVVGEEYLAYPSMLAAYGLDELRPHNPMAPAAQVRTLAAAFGYAPTMSRYFALFSRPDQPFLDFLNVRVVLSNRYNPEPAGFERIDQGEIDPWRLWRNPDALPRWFLARGAEPVPPEGLAEWLRRLGDPRRVAVAPAVLQGWRPALPGSGEVEVLAHRPGRTLLRLPLASEPGTGDRLLATSLPSPGGWRPRAGDGRRLPALAVNGAYLGVRVPPEVDRVELAFVPPGFWSGWVCAGLALLALLALGLREARSRRSSPGAS